MNNLVINKYPLVMRILHWMMAVIILGVIGLGMYMTELPKEDPSRGFFYNLHKSFGVTVLLLVALRVMIRVRSCIPPLPEAFSSAEKKIIHAGHFGLYGLMFLTPLAGYMLSCAAGRAVFLFGVELPSLISENKNIAEFFGEAHEVFAYTLLVLAILHVLAAIKHALDKNPDRNIMQRIK